MSRVRGRSGLGARARVCVCVVFHLSCEAAREKKAKKINMPALTLGRKSDLLVVGTAPQWM
jgi:hypothetical protein